MMRILLTGANGQVGWELCRTLAPLGKVVALDRQSLNLTNTDLLRRKIREVRPDIIVNAAAYTAVDKAEMETDQAMAINVTAPAILAEEVHALGGVMIHYSTDYVYDGNKSLPYEETDTTNPLNVYGRSKLAGEQAVAASGVPHLIFRTSWVYGLRGHNFLLTMRNLAQQRKNLAIVQDQIGAPTWCRMLAEATAQILAMCRDKQIGSPIIRADDVGIYHLTAGGSASWYDFARYIFELDSTAITLNPITSAEYPQVARRPTNSLLSNQKLFDHFGLVLPAWDDSLRMCLAESI